MSSLVIRPCSESVLRESGDGIVMDCRLSKKYRKNLAWNQTKKSRNQSEESKTSLMSVIITHGILLQSGGGTLTIFEGGSIWTMPTGRWIRIIWSRSCGSSLKSGRSDTSTKGSVFHGIAGSSEHQFQTLKSRWMIAMWMSRIRLLR